MSCLSWNEIEGCSHCSPPYVPSAAIASSRSARPHGLDHKGRAYGRKTGQSPAWEPRLEVIISGEQLENSYQLPGITPVIMCSIHIPDCNPATDSWSYLPAQDPSFPSFALLQHICYRFPHLSRQSLQRKRQATSLFSKASRASLSRRRCTQEIRNSRKIWGQAE